MPRSRVVALLATSLVTSALVAAQASPASAARSYSATASASYTAAVSRAATVSTTVSSTASYGTPPVTMSRSGVAAVSRTATVRAAAVRKVRVVSSSPSRARSLARSQAGAAARTAATAAAAGRAQSTAWTAAKAALPARVKAVQASLYAQALAAAKTVREPAAVTQAPCGGTTIYKTSGAKWTCTFSDDFTGTTLDPTKWMVLTTANSGVISGQGAALGCYTDSPHNISVSGGVLNLTARKEAAPFTCGSGPGSFTTDYTSGEIASAGHFAQTYGRFAVRAKFPARTVAGLHSALWMWPQNSGGPSGEIDIAEWYSLHPKMVMPTLHYAFDPQTINFQSAVNTATTWSCTMANASTGFHEYAVEWTSTKFVFRYDGQTCLTNNIKASGTSPFDQPFFLALTQALGGQDNVVDPKNDPLPGTTQIDWVRAWK